MRSRALHPLRSALVAVLVTAAVSADLGALPPTGCEVVLRVVVVAVAFLGVWVAVLESGLLRGDGSTRAEEG